MRCTCWFQQWIHAHCVSLRALPDFTHFPRAGGFRSLRSSQWRLLDEFQASSTWRWTRTPLWRSRRSSHNGNLDICSTCTPSDGHGFFAAFFGLFRIASQMDVSAHFSALDGQQLLVVEGPGVHLCGHLEKHIVVNASSAPAPSPSPSLSPSPTLPSLTLLPPPPPRGALCEDGTGNGPPTTVHSPRGLWWRGRERWRLTSRTTGRRWSLQPARVAVCLGWCPSSWCRRLHLTTPRSPSSSPRRSWWSRRRRRWRSWRQCWADRNSGY